MKNSEKYLLLTLLFLLPTQLALHFWPASAFVFGIRVDFLSPTLYLTDLLILGLLVVGFMKDRGKFVKTFVQNKIILVLIALVVINCLFSTSFFVSLYRWVKIAEYLFFVLYIAKTPFLDLKSIIKTLFYSSFLFSIIGLLQFIKGGTIGGWLYWLGERNFNLGTPGIALVGLNGVEHLRAYSTFAHPNSLAGFLGLVLIFCLLSGTLKKGLLTILSVVVISVCFLLTFSISSYFGLLVVLALFLAVKNKNLFRSLVLVFLVISVVLSLLLPVLSPWILGLLAPVGDNISQRLDLAYIAGEMISKRFWFGEGLGTFIVNIPIYKGIFSYSWILQPVHNIFLLVFSETGITGLLLFVFIMYKLFLKTLAKNSHYLLLAFVFIVFTGLFDHYSLTLQQNLLLFSLLTGLALR